MIDIILLFFGLIGVITAAVYTFKNKISFLKGICFATLSLVLMFVLSVLHARIMYNVSPIDLAIDTTFSQMKVIIDSLPKDVLSSLPFANIEPEQSIAVTMKSFVETFKNIYTVLFPSLVIIMYAFIVFVLFMIIKLFMRFLKKDVSFLPDFNEICVKKSMVLFMVFSMIMSLILSDTIFGNAFANILTLLYCYFMLCGVSLADFYLARKIKIGIVRFVVYVVLVFLGGGVIGILLQIAALMAVLDAFMDFRARSSQWV